MTTEQAIELGRRMMACKGFEWRPGMVPLQGSGLVPGATAVVVGLSPSRVSVRVAGVRSDGNPCHEWMPGSPWLTVPDIRDPGTVGHALAMMRALADGIGTGIPHCVPNPQNRYELSTRPAWGVMACGTPLGLGDTEAEAVINAWEALS